jgi:hypothetical protein
MSTTQQRFDAHTGAFKSSAVRLVDERDARLAESKRVLTFNDALLDDQLIGMTPHDLVLLGAESGYGKTQKVLDIAVANARRGKRVHMFALEAEPMEVERRLKYAVIAGLAWDYRVPRVQELTYRAWRMGLCEDIVGDLDGEATKFLRSQVLSLHTYYRGQTFGPREMERQILDVQSDTDLYVLDHLHYIDTDDDQNEASEQGRLVKTIRDVTLRVGRPTILVAHLRKRDARLAQLVPTRDDFHGSSNIVKLCTQVVTIAKCSIVEAEHWWQSPTFVAVLKERGDGAPDFAAVVNFDMRKKLYDTTYTLGRLVKNRTEWQPFTDATRPTWAKRHVSQTSTAADAAQGTLSV